MENGYNLTYVHLILPSENVKNTTRSAYADDVDGNEDGDIQNGG